MIVFLSAALIILLLIIFSLIYYNFNRQIKSRAELDQRIQNQLQQFQLLISQQLSEHRQTLSQTNQNIDQRLDQAARVFGAVQERLVRLDEGSKRIFEVGKDISSLQDILKTPKLRGNLGELFLGDMLSQLLPGNQYALQHSFKDGEKVDAIVKLHNDLLVPIDAKFPLENFRSGDQTDRQFATDVKKHIDAIANKYIRPAEGTLDFALMYIPAENVYYQTILRDDKEGNILNYAFRKKVIPVSPNTLYIYLQAILLGLKGYRIEQEARDILINLQSLNNDFAHFSKEFNVLGGHLQNAGSKYLDVEKQINKIGSRLETIDRGHEKLPSD